jgi:plasmid stabilization system protein ParE
MPSYRWLDDARAEALDVARKYLEIEPDLGVDLWDRIEQKLALAQRFPHTGKHIRQVPELELRQHFLERFPYTLVIAVVPDQLVIVAFHHQRQDDEYWRPRLPKVLR